MSTCLRRFGFASLMLGLTLAAGVTLLAQSDPLAGTWELNVDKSEFMSRSAAIMDRSIIVMPKGDLSMHEQRTNRRGGRGVEVIRYEAAYDGKDYKVTGAAFGTVSFTRMGNTLTRIAKNGGQEVETATYTLSPDGQMLTIVTKGKNYGITYGSTQVFERQTDTDSH